FAVVEHPIAPGMLAAPPHVHEHEHEASYVLEGEITAQVGDEIIHAPAGTLVLKPKGIAHTFWNQGTEPARILEIISPAGFERYFEELGELFAASGGAPDIERILQLAEKYGLRFEMSRVE